MNMRRFSTAILVLVLLLTAGPLLRLPNTQGIVAVGASTGTGSTELDRLIGAEQVLFAGDRTCNDLWNDCDFSAVRPTHRYLHVVVHDAAANADWQVQAGPYCQDAMPDIAGGQPLPATGYLEIVVDLATSDPSLLGTADCFVFRGRNHWAVTYFAAYFDDDPGLDADVVYPGYQTQFGRPAQPDLDVTYIHRTPSYPYDAAKNAPAVGDRVVFSAHVMNAGSIAAAPFVYRWFLDRKTILTGFVAGGLAAGNEAVFDFPWNWRSGPHTLEFRVFPADVELSRTNDALTIRTDALELGFWVEQSAWQYFGRYQWLYCSTLSCSGSDSFADWLEREVSAWNGLLASAVYAGFTPHGVEDRVRVDEITVVPDGSLPLHGGRPTNSPDLNDRTVDLQWGLPAAGVEKAYPHLWDGPFNVDWGMIHELGHARSLADMYRFDVSTGTDTVIDVTDDHGHPIYDAQDPTAPGSKLRAFYTVQDDPLIYQDAARDVMDCTCDHNYSVYTAEVLNRIQGKRPTCGNFNPPCNLGDWFLDLPPVNRLRLIDSSGQSLPDNTEVRVFYDEGTSYTGHIFHQADSEVFHTVDGAIQLDSDPFHSGGNRYLAGHNLLLLEIDPSGMDRFCFVEPTTFNLADWLGYSDAAHPATYILQVDRQDDNSCELTLPPPLVNEPFGTSPYLSRVAIQPAAAKTGTNQILEIQLRDSSTPPKPMRDRLVRVSDPAGKLVAQGTTNAAGTLRLSVRRGIAYQIEDVTDDSLTIPWVRAIPRTPAVRQRQ